MDSTLELKIGVIGYVVEDIRRLREVRPRRDWWYILTASKDKNKSRK
jgi:hypothetical protein